MNSASSCRNDASDLVPAGPAHAGTLAAIHAAANAGTASWDVGLFATLLGQPGVFGLIDPAGGMVLARTAADEGGPRAGAAACRRGRRARGRGADDVP